MDATATNDAPADTGPGRRWRTPVVLIAILAVVGVATISWLATRPGTTRSCTLAASLPNPVASTPEGAVDAWWQQSGPQEGQQWSSNYEAPQKPTRQDLVRVEPTRWEWRYTPTQAFAVDVGHPDNNPDTWTVVAVNRCTYGTT